MRRGLWTAVALLGGLAPGCSGSSSSSDQASKIGPHQGTLVKLPEDKGYAEILNIGQGNNRGARSGAPMQVAVYFLDPELKAPSAASPSGVAVKLTIVTGKAPTNVPLEPSAESGDPLGAKRFVSKAGAYHLSSAHGELAATLDGQPFSAEFDSAR